MPKFFTDLPITDNTVIIQGEDAAHLRLALRVKPGEVITVGNAQGWDYRCEIIAVDAQSVTCSVLEKQLCKAENPYFTTLYLCLTKGDKFELVVQKAVELGADRIVPVLSERCISRPDAKDAAKKVDRWQKIAQAAAKQSGRGKIPEVAQLMKFDPAVREFCRTDLPLFCYENAVKPLSAVMKERTDAPATVAAFIGPEGGFSPNEAAAINACGGIEVSLGARILRAETAPLALLCAINYAMEII